MIDAAQHLGLARMVVRRTASQWAPVMERDDAEGWAMVGLVKAARGYDSTRGLAFSTYARFRIHGEIVDAIRRELSDTHPPCVSLDSVRTPEGLTLADLVADPDDPIGDMEDATDRRLRVRAWRARLAAVLAELPPRRRQAMACLSRGMSQKEAAAALGVSQQRIWQFTQQAVPWIQARLRGERPAPLREGQPYANGYDTPRLRVRSVVPLIFQPERQRRAGR